MSSPDSKTDVVSLLISLSRSIHRTMRSAAPACSFLEMKTLALTHEHKDPSMKYLTDELGISSPATTAVVDRLVENGDLTRIDDKHDRRVTRVALTSQGKKTFEQTKSVIRDALDQRISMLTETERTEFARLLLKLQKDR